MGKLKKASINIFILAASFAVALLLCELGARIFLNSANFLAIEPVSDSILGMVPSTATKAGYDAWGFRNSKVPEQADIVSIGDSHTYGNTVRMEDSWPIVLGHLTGHTSYNMGMGGYGPNQYFYLLKTKALTLKPKLIICGLWMGDDFEQAYQMSYGLDYWSYLRRLPSEKTNYNVWKTEGGAPSWHKQIRIWLSRHSVVYQLVFHGSLLGRLQGETQIKVDPKVDPTVTALIIPNKHILEAFRPESDLRALDQQNPEIQEGMRITLKLLEDMKAICDQNHIQLMVVAIPTKDSVFAPFFAERPKQRLSGVISQVAANEGQAREKLFEFLNDHHIAYVDALPGLQASVEHQLYARTAQDMHPGRNGHQVIAQSIVQTLDQKKAGL
jgi:hypothetical protein